MDSPWRREKDGDDVSSSWHSHNTCRSAQTRSTAPTEYSYNMDDRQDPEGNNKPLVRMQSSGQRQYNDHDDPTSSTTYDSRDSSEQDSDSENDAEDDYDVNPPVELPYTSEVIASTPRNFAAHFPSDNRIFIRHDDSTLDGNMNLRLDTLVPTKSGKRRPMTLFHLRMHDLRSRDFSLRRYCRDSGREVCRSERAFQEAPNHQAKPSLQKSLSYALASLRRQNSTGSNHTASSSRADVESPHIHSAMQDVEQPMARKRTRRIATNTINLEFSNYAHVDIKRQGRGAKKCYKFEYWGVNYSWRRHIKQDGDFKTVSYHLFKNTERFPSAHIVPDALTKQQAIEEQQCGGWISQSSMWIKDQDIVTSLPDVADVVLATGIIALVDDTIKTTWPRRNRLFILPLFSKSAPRPDSQHSSKSAAKQLINTVFSRPQNPHRRHTSLVPSPYNHNRRRFTS